MSSFTPGPWRINEGRKYYDELHRICKDGNSMIATVVSIADASLIAAAPDLLEACEAMLKISNESEPFTDAGMWEHKLKRREIEDRARAVIKKARGET